MAWILSLQSWLRSMVNKKEKTKQSCLRVSEEMLELYLEENIFNAKRGREREMTERQRGGVGREGEGERIIFEKKVKICMNKMVLHLFIRVALAKYHELDNLGTQKLIFPQLCRPNMRSGWWQGWYLWRAAKTNPIHASALASGGFLAICGAPCLVEASSPYLCFYLQVEFSLVQFCLQITCLCKDTSHLRLGTTVMTF